ncbi:MAG: WD40 repeat domain-containing protein, partial [Cyanobacteria bacterium P01_A01_bin.114]
MAKHISTEVSKTVLNFTRGSHPEGFTVTVYNDSYKTPSINRFASFQLNILAAGQDQLRSNDWYRLVPAVSYKIPPGDSTQFQVEILDVPPISEDFTGTLNLTARVYSPELRDEDRKDILLKVAGDSLSPPKLSLPDPHLTAYPGEQVELEVTLFNPNRKAIDCGLVLQGLDPAWLSDGVQKTLMLPPRESRKL